MSTGLTLGKFAPLHAGHQAVIERGLAETDRMIVMIYDSPEVTAVPLRVRADWIRQIYPRVEILEAWDGPSIIGDTPEIRQMHEEYILRTLGDRKITHFYSSEFYGDHVSRALGALDCRVDPGRSRIPVSGTAIRADPFAHREWLDARVYRDLVTWVVFLGAPCTGKTTLCETLAKRHHTVWMPEYGREYWEANQIHRRLSRTQLVEIAQGHREREELAVRNANRYLFVDTDATTTRMFSLAYHGAVEPELEALAADCATRYDLFFLCEDDIPYDDTWDRSGEVDRGFMQARIREDLQERGVPFIPLHGSLEERIGVVDAVLQASSSRSCR